MAQMVRGVIFDIDGVLEYQGEVYPYAVDTIQKLRNYGLIVRFLTNSTLKSRASCARILREKGFAVFDEEVLYCLLYHRCISEVAKSALLLYHVGWRR